MTTYRLTRLRIANAGIVQVAELLEISEEDFQRMFNINVLGVHNCLAEAAKQLISQGDCRVDRPGKLLAAASIVAFKSFPLLPHYSASKVSNSCLRTRLCYSS